MPTADGTPAGAPDATVPGPDEFEADRPDATPAGSGVHGLGAAGSTPAGPLTDAPEPHRVLAGETVFRGTVWDVRRERVAYGDGTLTREFVRHPGAVGVLALDDRDRVALVHQYRHPVRARLWELPAGLLDVPGEAPLEAARRELAEEAELEAEDWEPLIDLFTTPGGSDERLRLYRATGLRHRVTDFERTGEERDMGLVWRPFAAVRDAVLAHRLHNPTLVVGVLAETARRARS